MDLVNLLGSPISRMSRAEAVDFCIRRLEAAPPIKRGLSVYFVNVHTLTESTENPALRQAFSEALCLADGVPIVWLSKLKGPHIRSRVCGPDFMLDFIRLTRTSVSQGLIGGATGIAQKLKNMHGLSGPCYSPPMRAYSEESAHEDWRHFIELCPDKKPPEVVWVGLGAPKQELWVQSVRKISPEVQFFAVGAAFDFLTGAKPRAPRWMQECGLEWLYRLYCEPRRLWKRYLVTNLKFTWLALRSLITDARRN